MIENTKIVLLFNPTDGHCHVTTVYTALEADPAWRVKVLIELGESGEFISCEKFLSQAERTTLEVPTTSSELSINDAQCKKDCTSADRFSMDSRSSFVFCEYRTH